MTSPLPLFDAIDYTQPEQYLSLQSSFVGPSSIDNVAQRLAKETPEKSLANIWQWLSRELVCRNVTAEYGWRPVTEIIARGRYVGCADHALVYGCLARACGIPTVWVKTLDLAWIRMFRQTGQFDGGKGHVYLEVFIEGEWRLLDASQGEMFDEYDTKQRLLLGEEGDRYAYDKGGDPRKLILSLDWNPWVEETTKFFSKFDLSLLERASRAVTGKGRRITA